ncbi:hypothetical protein NKG05_13995 [Oerskovia sp. M15]
MIVEAVPPGPRVLEGSHTMADVLLFHHSLGLTDGVRAFAETLREAGHVVHLPDLYEGRTFPDIESGMSYVGRSGSTRSSRAAWPWPTGCPTSSSSRDSRSAWCPRRCSPRPARGQGALLFSSCIPTSEFGDDGWPLGVPVQVHGMDADPFFVDEGDLDAARALVEAAPGEAELFLYPGDQHLSPTQACPRTTSTQPASSPSGRSASSTGSVAEGGQTGSSRRWSPSGSVISMPSPAEIVPPRSTAVMIPALRTTSP